MVAVVVVVVLVSDSALEYFIAFLKVTETVQI